MSKKEEWELLESVLRKIGKYAHGGVCCGCQEMIIREIKEEQDKYVI